MAALIPAASAHRAADREQRHISPISVVFLAAFLVVTSALIGCGGGSSTADVQPQSVPASVPAGNGTATLTWSAPTTNVDGTPLTTLIQYKVYYGTTPGVYASVNVGNVTSYQVVGLAQGQTYYFTITAYDIYGESDYAPVVSKLII